MRGTKSTDALGALLELTRAVSVAVHPPDVVSLLLDAVVAAVDIDVAVFVEVGDDGLLRVAGARGAPESTFAAPIEEDTVCPALGLELRGRAGKELVADRTIPMVSGGDLYGALVVLFRAQRPSDSAIQLAEAMADVAGGALGQAARIEELQRSYQELRASREVLARTAKLRALGEMAAGISHDLKNILNPISLYAQLAKRALAKGDSDGAAEAIGEVSDMVRRGVETIDRLREFSRQDPTRREAEVQLEPVVAEAVKLARARLAGRRGASITIDVAVKGTKVVRVQPADLVSALVNLIVNAIDAMPGGGHIRVTAEEDDGGVCLRVADDGPGMSPELERRVFEPFFTTKGAEGTGLGLAMVYAFAQRSGGRVSVATEVGKGSTFALWLPTVG